MDQDGPLGALRDPLSTVDALFHRRHGGGYNSTVSGTDFGERDLFDGIMHDAVLGARVPYLTKQSLGTIRPNSLIRYRGLVQDVYNTEYFVGVGVETNRVNGAKRFVSSKYRDGFDVVSDEVDIDFESPESKTLERLSLFCAPIPGESAWVRDFDCRWNAGQQAGQEASAEGGEIGGGGRKRALEEEEEEEEKKEVEDEAGGWDVANKKKVSSSSSAPSSSTPAHLNRPPAFYFDNKTDMCCLAKMYDCDDDSFRLNDMIELVGVYSLDYSVSPVAAVATDDNDDGDGTLSAFAGFELMGDLLPPTSIAPRLHCLTFRRIGSSFPLLQEVRAGGWMCIPLGGGVYAGGGDGPERGMDLHQLCVLQPAAMQAARAALLQALTRTLLGDAVAAEYVLLALLSRVITRTESVIVGCLPLVLSGFGAAGGSSLVAALRDVVGMAVPRSVVVDADLASLNKATVQPSKDYDRNQISPSPLQLGAGTVVLVDETGLEEGTLNENGVRSAHALRTVAMTQKLPVSFAYCEVQVPTDLPLIFLTSGQGTASLYATQEAVRVQLRPKTDVTEMSVGAGSVQEDWWHDVRKWWAFARLQEVTMDEHVAKAAEDDFVSARQADESLTPANFHAWLAVARLLALSHGEAKITMPIWTHMKALEAQRRRVASV